MKKKSENSERILLEILKEQKFHFKLHELDSILSSNSKKSLNSKKTQCSIISLTRKFS